MVVIPGHGAGAGGCALNIRSVHRGGHALFPGGIPGAAAIRVAAGASAQALALLGKRHPFHVGQQMPAAPLVEAKAHAIVKRKEDVRVTHGQRVSPIARDKIHVFGDIDHLLDASVHDPGGMDALVVPAVQVAQAHFGQTDDNAGHSLVIQQHRVGAAGHVFDADLHLIKAVFRQSSQAAGAKLLNGLCAFARNAAGAFAPLGRVRRAEGALGIQTRFPLLVGFDMNVHIDSSLTGSSRQSRAMRSRAKQLPSPAPPAQ